MVFFAGQIPTATELNDMAEIGQKFVNATATSDSALWNSGTKVLTNLIGSGVLLAGATYETRAKLCVVCDTGTGYGTCGIVYKAGGAAVATDTLVDANTTRMSETGAVYNLVVEGEFVAASSGTFGFAVIGWDALGTATAGLRGNATYAINRLTVKRIA